MNKPDWKDAPIWARFLAMNSDGDWRWWNDEPECYESDGIFDDKPTDNWNYSESCSLPSAKDLFTYSDWKTTLEERPQ